MYALENVFKNVEITPKNVCNLGTVSNPEECIHHGHMLQSHNS